MKRRGVIVVFLFLILGLSLCTSTDLGPSSVSPASGIESSSFTRNWSYADIPEGAVVLNNLEDFVDQLSDLHNESDIGTHSNPVALQALDGVYDMLTSDNITVPEQLIEDPMNETEPYIQAAYESWRLDLEGGWTAIDYDEISAELCVYGGTQAEEALRVDIWDNDGWINVIPDVVVGWNNVSISSSLVDETLEMRFTGSNTGNTSVQSSWQIDAVLLHTWTVVYSSEFTQHGILQDLGNNLSRYIASVGEFNTWNPVDETWYRYLYDPVTKTVQIGNLTITHLEGGALSIDGDAGSRVGKLSWYIQAYYGDQWNNITLDNYQFVGFTKTTESVTAHQRFWGSQGEMNVFLTYSYSGGFKTRVDIRNDAAQAVPIRAIWAARDVSGIQDNYELLYIDDVLSGIQIEDATFSWYDVIISDNPLPTQTVVDKPNRRAAVIFGNQSTVIPSGYTATIDPTYSVAVDGDDTEWDYWGAAVEDSGNTLNRIGTDGVAHTYQACFRVAMAIPEYSIVTDVTFVVSEDATGAAQTGLIYRIDSANVGTLEGGDYPTLDTDFVGHISLDGNDGLTASFDCEPLVQAAINEVGWASGNYIGFVIRKDAATAISRIDDKQGAGAVPYLNVNFVTASENWLTGWTYRQALSIDGSTGAGTKYPIKLAVEYGVGTSADGTIYCNEHSRTDFGDIRFTDVTGSAELYYWMEEKTDSDDATFWVNVTYDLGSDQVIYGYYGNAGESTTSSGDNTFILFDDFSSQDTGKWTFTGSSVSDGILNLGQAGGDIESVSTYGPDIALEFRGKQGGNTRHNIGFATSWPAAGTMWIAWDYDNNMHTYEGNAGYGSTAYVDDTWTIESLMWKNGYGELWKDRTTSILRTDADIQAGALDVGGNSWGSADSDFLIDWLFVRNWVGATEPASLCWSKEETPPPVNDQAPTLDNPSDSTYMYAHYVKYQITVYVSHPSGNDSIDYLELGIWNNARDTEYWRGRYDEDTDTFSGQYLEEVYVDLDTVSSSATESGNDIDATFYITVDWDFPDTTDMDAKCYVIDENSDDDTDWYEVDWDVETRLDSYFQLHDGSGDGSRGDYNTLDGITASGQIYYYGSGLYPPATAVDVWVSCSYVAGSPWSDLLLDVGDFSMTVDSDDIVSMQDYLLKVVIDGAGFGGTNLLHDTPSEFYISDYMTFISTTSKTWTIVGETITVTLSGKYAYDNNDVPSVVWTTMDSGAVSFETMGLREWNYSSSGDTYGITKYFTTNSSCIWDDVVFTSGPTSYWSQESETRVWFIWGVASAYEWDYNNSALQNGFLIRSIVNGTNNAYATTYGGSIGGLAIGVFGPEYYYANITITIDVGDYLLVLWYQMVTVDILHSLQIVNFNIVPTDDHFWITFQTNLLNASIAIWDDAMDSGTLFADNIYYSLLEGMHQIDRSTIIAVHNVTICITSTGTEYDRDYSAGDYVWWYNFTYIVIDPPAYDCHIVILNNLYEIVPFDTFEVYNNGTRFYHDTIRVVDGNSYNITVKNRFGDWVNTTAVFSAANEMVVFVNMFSLKFWSAYEGICYLTLSRGGVDYTEVLMPMEIVNFRLYSESYTYTIDYLDDRIMSGNVDLTASTGVVITNDTISDIFGLVDALWDMTDDINITVNTVADITYLIQLMFDWTNTTLYNQSITILASFNWDNTTLYNQTISLLNAFNATNTVIYDQIILIQNMFDWENTTLFNQTISILNAFNSTNTVIYSQTVSILSEISYMNSTIYGQTVSLLNYLYYNSSSIYNQTIDILTQLSLIGSNVTANHISLSSDLLVIDSNLYSNFTYLSAELLLIDSNLYSNFTAITATLSSIGSNITSNYISLSATLLAMDSNLYANFTSITATLTMIDSQLLSNFTELTAELLAVNSTIGSQFLSVSATLNMLDSSLLSNFTSISATLNMIDSQLLSNFTELTSELLAVNSTIAAEFLSVSATLNMLDSSLLSNFTSVSATLSMIDSQLLSNFTELTAELLAVNSTIAGEFLSVSATLSMIDSQLLSNFTELTSELLAVNSTIATQFLSVSATLSMIDGSLLSNFTEVTSTLVAIGSNVTTNYLSIVAELALIDSALASNFTEIVAQVLAVNSSIAVQFLLVVSNLDAMNATMFLIDDPTHLNPLVLGYSLSDDYCDFTVVTTWHNATIDIYDNNVHRTGPTSELLSPIRYPLLSTSGTHNLSVFIDGGADSFWYNISYTVAEIIAFEIEGYDFDLTDNWVYIAIQTNYNNGTFYIWDNTTYVGASYEGSYPFAINNTIGLHVLTVLMNCSQGSLDATSQNRTGINGDLWEFLEFRYTINPIVFSITNLMLLQNNESIIVAGTWHTPNTTLTWIAYEGNIEIDTGTLTLAASGEFNSIYWMKNDPITFNNFTLSITADSSTIHLHSYSLILDTATYISTVNAPIIVYEGDTFLDESTYHENPPGFYITAETAAIIAVSAVFIAFFAYLLVRNLLQKKRIDVESESY